MDVQNRREGAVRTGDGLELHYEISGRGPTLCLPAASWLAADFTALHESSSVLSFDVRGRGRSGRVEGPTDFGLERDLADLEELRAATGVEQMSLCGWSYYGLLAARYALEHPARVSRLVLVGPSAPRCSPYLGDFMDRFARRLDLERLEEVEKKRRQGLKENDPEAWSRAVHALYFRAYVSAPENLKRMRSSPCVEPNLDPEQVNNLGRKALEKLGDYDWTARFRSLDIPVLILHGTEDPVPIEGSREWLRALPDARMLPLEGVGHMPWLEVPELFFAAVQRFLAGDWPVPA